MLAYAQLLVTRSRGEVDRFVALQNPLPNSSFLTKPSDSKGLGVMGVFDGKRCLTAVRGQDTMASKFGYGDPSKLNHFKLCEIRPVPMEKAREFERISFLSEFKEDTDYEYKKAGGGIAVEALHGDVW